MVLHFKRFHVATAPFPLPLHVVPQLGRGHLLCLLRGDEELIGDDRQGDVLACSSLQRLMHAGESTFGIMVQMPVFQRVIIDTVGCRTRDKTLAFKSLHRSAIPDTRSALERLDIKHRTRFDFQLDITRVLGCEMLHVLVREG